MSKEWIGLIPAAGKGARLGLPYPKELYPVIRENYYKPIAQYVLNNLTTAGLRHIVFVINETKHQLIGFFGDGHRFGCDISYVAQECDCRNENSTSPGLAHALDSAYHLTQGKTVFFGMADTIMQPKTVFEQAYAAMHEGDDAILALFKTERPEKFGMVRMEQDGRVMEIVDKPRATDLKQMWGCIVWRPNFTDFLHDCITRRHLSDFALILNSSIQSGLRLRGISMEGGTYIDLGTYEEIMELDQQLREA
jgi:glucose-1-phosphate thymidylyltransferase